MSLTRLPKGVDDSGNEYVGVCGCGCGGSSHAGHPTGGTTPGGHSFLPYGVSDFFASSRMMLLSDISSRPRGSRQPSGTSPASSMSACAWCMWLAACCRSSSVLGMDGLYRGGHRRLRTCCQTTHAWSFWHPTSCTRPNLDCREDVGAACARARLHSTAGESSSAVLPHGRRGRSARPIRTAAHHPCPGQRASVSTGWAYTHASIVRTDYRWRQWARYGAYLTGRDARTSPGHCAWPAPYGRRVGAATRGASGPRRALRASATARRGVNGALSFPGRR